MQKKGNETKIDNADTKHPQQEQDIHIKDSIMCLRNHAPSCSSVSHNLYPSGQYISEH